ncbi:hypothetical protein HPB49_019033 [Dermacentor silvarum]|uniref:Uncharacterized protein n=1 Tax=Dermacentor silvarum TaxID=543639 RepID=A0ACB8CH32_DERSI|nr:hypothetical protein HPB49_019033 [Dermacentor silvarum]
MFVKVGRCLVDKDIPELIGLAGIQVGDDIIIAGPVLRDVHLGELGLDLCEPHLGRVAPTRRKLDSNTPDAMRGSVRDAVCRRSDVLGGAGRRGKGCRDVARMLLRRIIEVAVPFLKSHPPPDRNGNGASCPRWQRSLPPEVRSKIKANPIPKHMSHELHEGRRKARVDRQRRQFKGDPYITYVDVAAYPAGGLFAVAAVNGRDNSLTLAASVKAETPAAAETIGAALVIKQHDRNPIKVNPNVDLVRFEVAVRGNGETDEGPQLQLRLARRMGDHMVGTYAPSALLVVCSWPAFWLATTERLSLCGTLLLALTQQSATARRALPPSVALTPVDWWMSGCIGLVLAVIVETTAACFEDK